VAKTAGYHQQTFGGSQGGIDEFVAPLLLGNNKRVRQRTVKKT
jgi:hypothetical protein